MELYGTFRVSQVEHMTGVGVHTLRAWERRYGVPRPPRSEGRQRRYTQEDVQLVRRMKQLADGGLTLSESADVALREARLREASGETQRAYELLLGRLTEYDERGAYALWVAATEGRTVPENLERIAIPLLVRTGELWESGQLSIGTEHFISAFLRGRLEQLYRSTTVSSGFASGVLLACLPGERHELGLMMLAIMLRYDGLPTTFLGADLPVESLLESVAQLEPLVVVLYAAAPEVAAVLSSAVTAIQATCPAVVVFGGQAFDSGQEMDIPGAIYGGPTLSGGTAIIADLYRQASKERNKS